MFDEVTNNVDIDTENHIIQVINHDLEDSTVVTVAHMLNYLKEIDKFVDMEHGRVVMIGTPERVMARGIHALIAVDSE